MKQGVRGHGWRFVSGKQQQGNLPVNHAEMCVCACAHGERCIKRRSAKQQLGRSQKAPVTKPQRPSRRSVAAASVYGCVGSRDS